MSRNSKIVIRMFAILLGLGVVLGVMEIYGQMSGSDDGGPPIGAICLALPLIVTLIMAGWLWGISNEKGGEK